MLNLGEGSEISGGLGEPATVLPYRSGLGD